MSGEDPARADAGRDPVLDRAYSETARAAPPAWLDDAILAAAHREAGSGPRGLGRSLRAWRVPVAIAAVIVLSVSVVLVMREEGADPLRAGAPASAPRLEEREARRQEPGAGKAPEPAGAISPSEESLRPRGAPSSAGEVPQPERDRRASAADRVAPTRERGDRFASEPAAAAPPEAPPAPFSDQQGPARGERARSAESPAPAGRLMSPRAAESVPPVPDQVAGRTAEQPEAKSGAELAARELDAPAALRAPARFDAKSANAMRPAWLGLEGQPAGKWLERIAELRKEGRAADADAVIAEFRRRFPGHSVPPPLDR